MNKLKVIELFAGIGAVHKALKNINMECEIIDAIEIDKNAIKAYNAIHNTNFEPQDITTWNKNIKCDYLHSSTPCQAFSTAGKGQGANDVRGGILWEHTLRIIDITNPKIFTLENVKGLLAKKHSELFNWFISELKIRFKFVEWKILNAKDFGIPQNRERVFIVAKNEPIIFPEPQPLEKKLKDYLENSVNMWYFLTQSSMLRAVELGKIKIVDNLVSCITTKQWRWNNAGAIKVPFSTFNQENYVRNTKGIINTITAQGANSRQKIVVEFEHSELPYIVVEGVPYNLRIITEREAFRLMSFDDFDFDKASQVISRSNLYNVAGNSIVVKVVEKLLEGVL